jgi:hypothetical protein
MTFVVVLFSTGHPICHLLKELVRRSITACPKSRAQG